MTIAKTEAPAIAAARGFGEQTETINRKFDTVIRVRKVLRVIANTRYTGLRGAA